MFALWCATASAVHSAYAPPLAPQVHDSGSMTALIWRGNVVRHEPGAWGQGSFLFVAPGRLKPAHFVERRHRVFKDICQQSWGGDRVTRRLACNNGVRNLRTFTTKVVRSGPTGTKEALAPYPLSGVSETREQSDFKPHWVLIDVDTRRAICRARRVCRRILLMLHCGGNRAAGYLTVGTVQTSVCFFQQAK